MTRRKSSQRVVLARNITIGFAVVLIAGVAGYGLLYSTGVGSPSDFVEGEHYLTIEGSRPPRRDAPITVAEYFSYACIHCRSFDPILETWVEQASDVAFERSPVAFSNIWEILSRGYYALLATDALEQNHQRIFRAIHDNAKQFVSAEMLAEFVDGYGVSRDEFLTAYDSSPVRREAASASRRTRQFGVTAVPTLIVADRYLVNVGQVGRRESLEVVDFLLESMASEAGRQAAPVTGEAAPVTGETAPVTGEAAPVTAEAAPVTAEQEPAD